jgi:hypothetical protein
MYYARCKRLKRTPTRPRPKLSATRGPWRCAGPRAPVRPAHVGYVHSHGGNEAAASCGGAYLVFLYRSPLAFLLSLSLSPSLFNLFFSFFSRPPEQSRHAAAVHRSYLLNVRQTAMQAGYFMAVNTFLVSTVLQASLLLCGARLCLGPENMHPQVHLI